jgi:Transmembrane secretion effector
LGASEPKRLDLREPDLWRVLADSALASVGMGGELVVAGWLVYDLTGSSLGAGTLYAIHFLPLGLVGFTAGVISDRVDRRRLLRGIELALVLVFSLYALLIATGWASLWSIYLLSFASGCCFAAYFPVRAAYAHDLVGSARVVSGLGLITVAARSGEMLGALAAGAAIVRSGPAAACALLAAAHASAFLVLRGLQTPGVSHAAPRVSLAESLRESGQELGRNRALRTLVLVAVAVEIFAFSYWTVLPEIADTRLGMPARGLSYLHAARAVGGLLAGLALASTTGLRLGRAYLSVIFGFGAGLWLLASASTLLLCVLAVLWLAALESSIDVLNQGMMQASVPDRLRGRAMGAWALAIGISPLGHLQMGALAAGFGVQTALALHGSALLGVALLVALRVRTLRRL